MNKTKSQYYYYVIYLSVVFFNTFVDLGHKVLIQDIFYQTSSPKVFTIMSAIVNAFILLPYIFMFTPSGFIADKFSKTTVLRVTAFAALPLTILITIFYYLGYFWLAFFMTLLLAIQSTLNSPAKYGYIKELFGKDKLAEMNGYVQTIIIISILLSTFVFSAIFQNILNPYIAAKTLELTKSSILKIIAPVGFILIFCSLLESISTLLLSYQRASDPLTTFEFKKYMKFEYLKNNVNTVLSNQTILICILALSVFWGINQVILANYGAYLKEYIKDASILYAQGSLAIGGVGVLIGAIYTGRKSKNFIETGFIPLASIGIVLGLFFMPMVTNKITILLLFFVYGFFGGMLVVPLNALIQFHAPDEKLGRILAGNNFSQNIFMILFLLITVITASLNIDSIAIFRILFAVALIGAIYSIWRLPQALIRYIVLGTLAKFYHVKTLGMENIPSTGPAVLLGNHISYIDWAFIQITCPRSIHFVMERVIYNKWYLKWFFKLFHVIPISSDASKNSILTIKECLQKGQLVALFPEGFISRNGHLGKFHNGYELAIKDTDAVIIPFYIRGLWGSVTSLATSHYRKISKNFIRHITVCYGKALPKDIGTANLKTKILQLSFQAWSSYANELPSIPEAILHRLKQQKNNTVAIETNDLKFSGLKAITVFIALRKFFKKQITSSEKNIGVLLPTSFIGVLINIALLSLGKIVVNLNYTADKIAINHALKISEIKTIVTSNIFLDKLTKKGFDSSELSDECNLIYLENHKNIFFSKKNWLVYLTTYLLPFFILKRLVIVKTNPKETAIIYFTSGSEGLPKGVELSHQNILVNAKQTSSVVNIKEDDSVLSCLPLFHAFGLTVTSLLPLIEGILVVFQPDPTNAISIAKTIAKYKITFLCGTSTFLHLYTRNSKVHPLMFKSLRLVVSGAEKLATTVAEQFYQKFGIHILEGYGATETSPIISLNLPDILVPDYWHIQQGYKPGSVGMALPGTQVMIVDPETLISLPINEQGMIVVAGPQIMQGYLHDLEKSAQSLVHINDLVWYITGDKGYLDEEGYISIVDRYSRFAKIAGEMISLTSVENAMKTVLPIEAECVAINIPDEKRGERIVLLVANTYQDQNSIEKSIFTADINSLMKPANVITATELPKLGSGKIDYLKVKQLAIDRQQIDNSQIN